DDAALQVRDLLEAQLHLRIGPERLRHGFGARQRLGRGARGKRDKNNDKQERQSAFHHFRYFHPSKISSIRASARCGVSWGRPEITYPVAASVIAPIRISIRTSIGRGEISPRVTASLAALASALTTPS